MDPAQFTRAEIHPFEFKYIPEEASHLIIGSFPTTLDKMAFNFYYPNSLLFSPKIRNILIQLYKT